MIKEVSLMFSGGVDSTFSAVVLAANFDRIHLLTYTNEYGHFDVGRAQKRYCELRKIVGDKYFHKVIHIKDVFDKIVLADIDTDYGRYGSGFIWCMGCKMVMHAQTIIYNRVNGIKYSCDGSSASTTEMVEQMPSSLEKIKDFYADNSIEFFLPVYAVPREEEIRELEKKGFFMGKKIWDRHLGIQPRCVPGEIYYLPYLLFNLHPEHDKQKVSGYIDDKIVRLQKIIDLNLNKS